MICASCGKREFMSRLHPTSAIELVCDACLKMIRQAEDLALHTFPSEAHRASDSGLPVDTINPRY